MIQGRFSKRFLLNLTDTSQPVIITVSCKKMNRLNSFILIVATFFLFSHGSEKIGVAMQQANGHYHFSAGTNIVALLVSPIFIAFLFLRKPKGIRESISDVVPLWRRFTAFLIDFMSALLPISALLALPAVLLEWHYTGTMSWEIVREFSRPSDTLLALGLVPAFAWMIFYFSYPLTRGTQTIGQYISGYRIAAKDMSSVSYKVAIARTIFSFLVLCLGWLSVPLAFFNKRKHMLHDSVDGLRPELVIYKAANH